MVQDESFVLIDQDNNRISSPPASKAKDPILKSEVGRRSTEMGIMAPGILLMSPLYLISVGAVLQFTRKDFPAIKENMLKRALFERVLYNGESNQGFVYFLFENQDALKKLGKLEIIVNYPTTEEVRTLRFNLDLRGKGEK